MSVTFRDCVTGEEISVEPHQIDDALAMRLLPQDEITQRLYVVARSGEVSVIGAMSRAILLRPIAVKRGYGGPAMHDLHLTPGDWDLWPDDDGGWIVDTKLELGNSGPVAVVRAFDDARLFAAAPALLAACAARYQEVLEWHQRNGKPDKTTLEARDGLAPSDALIIAVMTKLRGA